MVSEDGIEILGTRYGPTLKEIYDEIIRLHGKPIEAVEVSGRVDNAIEVLPEKIILRLHRGATEDNVAHELVHANFQAEGFPQPFAVHISNLSQRLYALIAADFDHLIINDRLLELGYDARKGFLSHADSFEKVLELSVGDNPNERAVLLIGLLHELIKFHYYIGRDDAQPAILAKFPQVKAYWEDLSAKIQRLPAKPTPPDIWGFVEDYVRITGRLTTDLGATFRLSDLIGFQPVIIPESQLGRQARELFKDSAERVDKTKQLVRTFTARNVLVWAVVTTDDYLGQLQNHLRLPVEEFGKAREIRIHVVR